MTHTHTIQAKERAKSQNAESSRHYEQAERGLSEAEQLLDAGKPADARPLLENATREFALAGLATRARTAEETMTRSRESAFSLGLSAESPGVEAAESMASDARLAYASQSYHQAIERFTTATALLDEVIENTLRSRATQARKDVTETLAKIGPEADRSAPVLQAARQHIRSAESALSDADFLRAFDLFDAARRLLEELQLELVTDTAEHDMHEALSRALSVGVSGELGELAVGLSHRRMGESLRAENNLDAARVAFESATKAFEQAVLVEREMRALRARDAAAAVRGSAARNGADTLEHFAWSNARFDEGVASLTRGEYETAYVRFREAQNGFDQAAVEWAATQAQKATISALDETRIAGVPEDDIAVVTALAAMERATELRSIQAFGEAAEILASTRQSLQTVVDELRATRVESARSQALNTKARLPAAHDSLKFIEGEQILAKAEEALQAGELTLAVSRFKAAKDQFEVALREAAAIEGRDNVARVHAGASALGARESDLLFAQGIEQEQAAAGHLEVLRFSEAK